MGKNGSNIANGVLSGLVILMGIVFTVLIAVVEKKIIEMEAAAVNAGDIDVGFLNNNLPIWALGFAYIVPGLIGVIGAATKKKGLYITQMVFSIITLLIMGIIFVIGLIALAALATYSPNTCFADGNFCKCGDISFNTASFSCSDMTQMYAMGVTMMVMAVLAWILVLATTIISGVLICRRDDSQPIVFHQPMPGMVSVSTGVVHQQGYYPQHSDTSKLANNMHY